MFRVVGSRHAARARGPHWAQRDRKAGARAPLTGRTPFGAARSNPSRSADHEVARTGHHREAESPWATRFASRNSGRTPINGGHGVRLSRMPLPDYHDGMDDSFLKDARQFAEALAARAGDIVREMSGRALVERKADDSMVTETDRHVESLIREAIAGRYPDHAFVGEEMYAGRRGAHRMIEAEHCWVVDPIDGTRNFAHGFPMVATSIALMRGARPVVGVVAEHHTGVVYSAVAGRGAHCGDRRIRVHDKSISRDTLVAVPSGRHQPILPIIRDWVDRYVLRNVGSTALHMAYVAAGAVDAAFGYECKLWDVAAGALLIGEAGGRCTGLDGRTPLPLDARGYDGGDIPFFCASPAVFEPLLASLAAPLRSGTS